jgi:hypothetical protein
MTTERQAEANRRNALASTGPRTPNGKAAVARNAVKHGALSSFVVLPGVERVEDWQAHHDGIMRDLAPVGPLETRLAERAALLLWRLDRVARYEAAVTTAALDKAGEKPHFSSYTEVTEPESYAVRLTKAPEELADNRGFLADAEAGLQAVGRLPSLPDEATLSTAEAWAILEAAAEALPENSPCPWVEDEAFLTSIGASPPDDFDEVKWTAGLVRAGLSLIGKHSRTTPDQLVALAARGIEKHRDDRRRQVKELTAEVRGLRERHQRQVERKRAYLLLPEGDCEGKVLRYESHLSRQLFQALHELERLQATRAGKPVPPPLAVEVGVSVAGANEGPAAG